MASDKKIAANAEESRDLGAVLPSEMLASEREWVAKRRAFVEDEAVEIPDDQYVGLGLSGGGIRSAVFNLGLLQALENHGFIKQIDYMSTVSGGGYIGSCLTWLKSIRPDQSPFGKSREDYSSIPGEVLSWLRSHGKYLTAGDGLSAWSLVAALLTGTLVNLLVVIPPLLLVIFALTRDLPFISPDLFRYQVFDSTLLSNSDGFALITLSGFVLLGAFVLLSATYVVSTGIHAFRKHKWQRAMRIWQGRLLMFGTLFLVIGTVPLVHVLALKLEMHVLADVEADSGSWKRVFDETATFLTFLTGLLTMVLAKPNSSEDKNTSNARKIIFSFGLTLLIYGLFLIGFDLMKDLSDPVNQVDGAKSILSYDQSMLWSVGYQVALGTSIFLALFINVNDVSMHRYYRNRLMDAFMPVIEDGEFSPEPDSFLIHRSEPLSDAPYQIINTSVNMVGSKDIRLQGRGADNFILSPLYCGSLSTAYVKTDQYVGGKMDLATAFSISGAAVDPNSYATRSRSVSFLMSLLNIRLGYWIKNPRFPPSLFPRLSRPRWYVYLLSEMLGSGLNADHSHVHLSDGGHFENLGLYELIRRHCKYIIVSDAGEDRDYAFLSLAKVIEMVRVDFGAQIDIDLKELEPRGEKRYSERSFVVGRVDYPEHDEPGWLIYVKPVITSGMPEDIYGYRRTHPDFPQENTANQFFDESQFEAYRELGFQVGRQLCHSIEGRQIVSLFAQSRQSAQVVSDGDKPGQARLYED